MRLIIGLLLGAVLGLIWPNFLAFRPITIGLAATCLYAIVWMWMFGRLIRRHGWKHVWVLLGLPLVLFWPATYAFMVRLHAQQ
ncbi:MAG: hypothetical protein JO122_21820 [Acetobacteraceae bacterium]|nr:hypothetical protein [Acetobacteraceae bacterium]